MAATHNDEHKIPASGNTKGSAETPDRKRNQTEREGPARVPHELDRKEQWDDAARDKGYQRGDQGGYKADYDQGKYENRDFGFKPAKDEGLPAASGQEPEKGENKK
ncbi:hypothetical protein [Achromobacter aloeverae]